MHTTLRLLAASLALTSVAAFGTTKPVSEHFQAGGADGIEHARYGFSSKTKDPTGVYQVFYLPKTDAVYMIPFSVLQGDDAAGALFQMQGDCTVTIMRTGMYSITANLDWPGQQGTDANLRKILVQRVPIGTAVPTCNPQALTEIPYGTLYETLASHDTPGSDVPNYKRLTVNWTPGTVNAGSFVTLDVPLPTAGVYTPDVGDAVDVSLTTLGDATLGAASSGFLLSGRVVAPNLVRVWLENRYNTAAVKVPQGKLNVTAKSQTSVAGNSSDAWSFLNTGPTLLYAGEKIFMAARVSTAGDYIQLTKMSFMQFANVGQMH